MKVCSRGVPGSLSIHLVRCSIILLLSATLWIAAPVLAFDPPAPGLHVVDEAGVLTDQQIEHIEAAARRVEQAGAPVGIYVRLKYASTEEAISDGRALMDAWDVQSAPNARDGVVIIFNLDPWDPEHGAFAIIAGETHYQDGALPQRVLDWIRDDMTKLLIKNRIGDAIVLGLDKTEEALKHGSPSQQDIIVTTLLRGPLSLLNVIAVGASGLLYVIGVHTWAARPRVGNAFLVESVRPPGDLHPTYAGALVDASVEDAHLEAAVLELARRGAIAIEPVPGTVDKVQIRLTGRFHPRAPFEIELMNTLQELARGRISGGSARVQHAASVIANLEGSDDGETIGPSGVQLLRGTWKPLKASIERELVERGWFDSEASRRRRPLVYSGLIAIGAAFAMVLWLGEDDLGWTVLGMGALFLTGMMIFKKAKAYPKTTIEGERVAMPWRGFRAGLQRGRNNPYGTIDLDEVFPYIVALNLAGAFSSHFKAASKAGYVPQWLARHDLDPSGRARPDSDWTTYWDGMHHSMSPPRSSSGSGGSSGGASSGSGGSGGRF
jgi:uncharacterized membrane protein YgcG